MRKKKKNFHITVCHIFTLRNHMINMYVLVLHFSQRLPLFSHLPLYQFNCPALLLHLSVCLLSLNLIVMQLPFLQFNSLYFTNKKQTINNLTFVLLRFLVIVTFTHMTKTLILGRITKIQKQRSRLFLSPTLLGRLSHFIFLT